MQHRQAIRASSSSASDPTGSPRTTTPTPLPVRGGEIDRHLGGGFSGSMTVRRSGGSFSGSPSRWMPGAAMQILTSAVHRRGSAAGAAAARISGGDDGRRAGSAGGRRAAGTAARDRLLFGTNSRSGSPTPTASLPAKTSPSRSPRRPVGSISSFSTSAPAISRSARPRLQHRCLRRGRGAARLRTRADFVAIMGGDGLCSLARPEIGSYGRTSVQLLAVDAVRTGFTLSLGDGDATGRDARRVSVRSRSEHLARPPVHGRRNRLRRRAGRPSTTAATPPSAAESSTSRRRHRGNQAG